MTEQQHDLTTEELQESQDMGREYAASSGRTKKARHSQAAVAEVASFKDKLTESVAESACVYDTRLAVDSRTHNGAKLKYAGEIVAETYSGICFRVANYTTGGWHDTWFPKKLCTNLDPEERTFWVWLKFMEEHKPAFIPKGYRVGREKPSSESGEY